MRSHPQTIAIAIAFVLAASTLLAQDSRSKSPVLQAHDPVELAQGRETKGSDEWTLTRGPFRYVFASRANLEVFEKDPARFEVQFGGACGRMGPGSGRGSPSRFGVHDGRIYLFASDQCRAAFLKAPEKFLDPDDAVPAGDDAARAAGAALVEKAVAALGGAARLGPDATFETSRTSKVKTKDGDREDGVKLRVSGDRHRLDETWGNWSFTTIVTGDRGFTIGNDEKVEDLDATAVRDFHRKRLRDPVLLLRARKRPDFVATAVTVAGDPALAYVAVSTSGATTILGVDPKTGEVRESRHRGRGPELYYGDVVQKHGDFREAGGVTLSYRVEITFDGKARPDATVAYENVRLGGTIEPAVFDRPSAKR